MSSWEEKYNKLKQEFDDYKESVKLLKATPKKRTTKAKKTTTTKAKKTTTKGKGKKKTTTTKAKGKGKKKTTSTKTKKPKKPSILKQFGWSSKTTDESKRRQALDDAWKHHKEKVLSALWKTRQIFSRKGGVPYDRCNADVKYLETTYKVKHEPKTLKVKLQKQTTGKNPRPKPKAKTPGKKSPRIENTEDELSSPMFVS
jgi:hypothetical protein